MEEKLDGIYSDFLEIIEELLKLNVTVKGKINKIIFERIFFSCDIPLRSSLQKLSFDIWFIVLEHRMSSKWLVKVA